MYATFDVGTTSMQSFPKNTQEQISKSSISLDRNSININ